MQAATRVTPDTIVSLRISIPAAYAGCDGVIEINGGTFTKFQSPQPMQAATRSTIACHWHRRISIPAAYAGCDVSHAASCRTALISIPAAYAGCDA